MFGFRRRNGEKAKEIASPELVRQIGTMDTYEGADADQVIERLRNMTYGSTMSEVVKLRNGDQAA